MSLKAPHQLALILHTQPQEAVSIEIPDILMFTGVGARPQWKE